MHRTGYKMIFSEELYHHGTKGMHWGVRNGPPYPLDSSKLTKKIYQNAKEHEPKLTSDVTTAAKNAGSKMYGLEHRLKTKDSIERKILTDAEEKKISESKAASDIKDAVRYTTITDDNQFVESYNSFKDILSEKGYKEVRCKNYWDLYKQGKAKHKSVQSVFQAPDGYLFEVQFQTPSSQVAKDKKVPIYEERRKPGLSHEKQLELEKQMDKLAQSVSEPKDVYQIRSH